MRQIEKHPLFPDFVPVEIPRDEADAKRIREGIQKRLDDWTEKYGPLPVRCPAKISIHSERRRSYEETLYSEQYITYRGESGETIPAWLLVPEGVQSPMPAVVANHQCNVDCDLGKDAVIGKSYNRPDQVYGFELMLKGFAVLAPDSINCGERAIPGLKGPECDKSKCWQTAIPYLSVGSFYLKHMWDATRAVDVLESLEFEDSNRIGMIGHSLGAGTTFYTTAVDKRIRASIMSSHGPTGLGGTPWYQAYGVDEGGIYYHELLALVLPRALYATRGTAEKPAERGLATSEDECSIQEWAFAYAGCFCDLYGVDNDTIVLRVFEDGHEFPEDERKHAYNWLRSKLRKESKSDQGAEGYVVTRAP